MGANQLNRSDIFDRVFDRSQWDLQVMELMAQSHRFAKIEEIQSAEVNYYLQRIERERELADIRSRLKSDPESIHPASLQQRECHLLAAEKAERERIDRLYREQLTQIRLDRWELKLSQIQAEWDRDTWFSKLSRQETELILHRHRQRLLILIAPPKLDKDRQLKLWKQIDFDLEMRSVGDFLGQHYPPHSTSAPVRFYSNYFREPIGDLDVERLHQLLSPIATYVFYGDIRADQMAIRIAHWGIQSSEVHFLPPIMWQWQNDRAAVVANGQSSTAADRMTIDIYTDLHRFLTAYAIDLYYLGIAPHYQPQLEQAVSSLDPNLIQIPTLTRLRHFQQERKDGYDRELASLARLRQEQQINDNHLLRERLAQEISRREEVESQLQQQQYETQAGRSIEFLVPTTDKRGVIQSENSYVGRCLSFDLGNGIWLELMAIPGGKIMIGDRELDAEKPIHQIEVPTFYLGKYPITQIQYRTIVGENPAHFSGDLCPVEQVTPNGNTPVVAVRIRPFIWGKVSI
jgi:hypothetical protein